MAQRRRLTTDSGTVVFHAILFVSFSVLLMTGLRIASDDPVAPWLRTLDLLLPVEDLWFRHMTAAMLLVGALAGHAMYLVRSRLIARVRLDKARIVSAFRPGQARSPAIHTFLLWGLLLSLLLEIGTGSALIFGFGEPALALHLSGTWLCLCFVALHIVAQYAMGGIHQVCRVFRSAVLVVPPPPPDLAELLAEQLEYNARKTLPSSGARPPEQPASPTLFVHPAALGCAVLVAVFAVAASVEQATRPVLKVREIASSEAPVLDGDLSDPAWRKTIPVSALTTQGGDFGGKGESVVEVRALHDDQFAYFAFVWQDPTRSLKHLPMIKSADGWQVAQTDHDKGNEVRFNEDKFAVLIGRPAFPLIGAAIHLSSMAARGKAASATGRGLHFTKGAIADVWVWRASHQGLDGHIDNCHFGGLSEPTIEEVEGRARYKGGFALDPGPAAYVSNAVYPTSSGGPKVIHPLRLPRDLAVTAKEMGRINIDVDQSESEGSRWWMSDLDTVPYTPAADAALPIGTVIPGIIMHTPPNQDGRSSVRGVARWASGHWTLELARRLDTGSAYDLPIKSGMLMWVAAFDHSESRHTRHLRPFRLEVE